MEIQSLWPPAKEASAPMEKPVLLPIHALIIMKNKESRQKPTPRKLPFTTSEEISELPESPPQHCSTPTLDWSSLSPEENRQMELDPLDLAMPKAKTSHGTYAMTVPPAERREKVESSCHESNPSKQHPLEGI